MIAAGHRVRLCAVVMLAAACVPAWAHGPEGHADGSSWLSRWNFDPLIIFNLTVLGALYLIGLRRLWGRTGGGRRIGAPQATAFAAAMVALVIALLSPLDLLSDELGYMHMIQHMTLMMVAAPLFVLSAPLLVMLWALPASWRRAFGRLQGRLTAWRPTRYLLWQPLALWSTYAFVLWIWHLPVFYEAALRNRWIHEFQHVTFFVASCLFWRVLVDPVSRLSMNRAAGVIYLFTTSLHATLLGVFMALAPTPWYADYVGRTEAFRLTALQDQQLAGLIMWMPACAIYAIVAAWIFAILIRSADPVVMRPEPALEGVP
jgi:putative membrane protein